MKKKRNLRQELFVLPWALLLLLPVLVGILCSGGKVKKKSADVAAGLDYIALQAAKDPAEVDRAIRKQANEALRLQAEADLENALNDRLSAVDNGEESVWGLFKDYVILGDSRAVGFSYYDFLDDSRVIADGGNSIRDIADAIDAVKTLNPAYVYLCYGLNDTGVGYWDTAEEYAKEMDERITQLQAAVPGVTVVVNSILPATEAAMVNNPVWRKIPSFSAAAKEVCEKKGVPFVNNDPLAEKYMSTLWDEDGVHLMPEFYPIWARNMIAAAMQADPGQANAGTENS